MRTLTFATLSLVSTSAMAHHGGAHSAEMLLGALLLVAAAGAVFIAQRKR